jgi:hypothetical protein
MYDDFNFERFRKLEKILKGDLSEVQEQLSLAASFLLLFEQFKNDTTSIVRDFYYTVSAGKKYEDLKKHYGEGKKRFGRSSDFRTAMYFMHEHCGITEKELDQVECFYTLRNNIGHELISILTSDAKPHINKEDVRTLINIYEKTKLMWVE